jgi:hypothetical protein
VAATDALASGFMPLSIMLFSAVLAWPWDATPPTPPPPPPPASLLESIVAMVPMLQGWDLSSFAAAAFVLATLTLLSAAVGESAGRAKPWPADISVMHACAGGVRDAASLWQRLSGALAATIFTVVYILVPVLLFVIPTLVFFAPGSWVTWALAGPFLLSALTPPIASRSFLLA